MTKTVVTSALPYANGAMHLGHVRSTYIPADIYVRYLRLSGRDVVYVCGTDEHGTPIGVTAEKEGKTPQQIADQYHRLIAKDLKDLGISFDVFSQTSSKTHHKNTQDFYNKIKENGYIYEKEVKQPYCASCKRFLPDRYVEGICAFCGGQARGDHCESCGRHLEPSEVKDPHCTVCAAAPEIRETTHYFFRLSELKKPLQEWISSNAGISSNARNYARQWIKDLHDWDITRDLDWGVKIPDSDKTFYVWFDAPIGYISFTKELTNDYKEYWTDNIVHFIGKDIIYHHALFWPAMLKAQGEFALPRALQAGGFLTLEGEKMSTSRNHVVWIADFLKAFPADYLRYYLISAAALDQDIDFSWHVFMDKINNELIGNLGNFVNRVLSFCSSKFDGVIPKPQKVVHKDSKELVKALKATHKKVSGLLNAYDFAGALKEILALSARGNEYFQKREPWKRDDAGDTIYYCVNLVHTLSTLISPYLPGSSDEICKQLGLEACADWNNAKDLVVQGGHKIGKVGPIFRKIEEAEIKAQIAKLGKSKAEAGKAIPSNKKANQESISSNNALTKTKKKMIEFKDFEKLDLRVAEIKDAKPHPDADKLLVLDVDLGGEKRQIVAGLKGYYEPKELKGKKIVIVANLKPAKLRGVESQGMLLAAASGDKLSVLTLDKKLENGAEVA